MRRESVEITVLFLALIAVSAQTSAAQEREGGKIAKIAQIVAGGKTRNISDPSLSVQVQSEGSWTNAPPGTTLRWNDMLLVAHHVHVKVDVTRSSQRGNLTFAPEPLQEKAWPVYYTVASDPMGNALYRMVRDSARPGDVAIHVHRGAVMVDWLHGEISIIAAGHPIRVYGTRLVVWVDPSGDEALVFIESGQIAFPEYPRFKVFQGYEVRLRRGEPPQAQPAGSQLTSNYQNAIQYNTHDLWTELTPFWRQPTFLIPAAQVVLVGAAVGVMLATGSDDTAVVSVTIRFPF